MIAWTVATPDMMAMAKEAMQRALRFSNIERTKIIKVENKHDAHREKLAQWLRFDGWAWYMDADWFLVRGAFLPSLGADIVFGAPNDTPNMDKYAGFANVRKSALFCTCLIGADASRPAIREMFKEAIDLQKKGWRIAKEDEKHLNIAISNSDVISCRLSQRWNWCGENAPLLTNAIHAAGRINKHQWLKQQCRKYEQSHLDK